MLLIGLACLAVLIAPYAAGAAGRPAASAPYGVWEAFIGTGLSTPTIPDYHVNYFAFSITRSGDARYTGLPISGQFGDARYTGFSSYRAHRGPSLASFTDFEITLSPGSIDPFIPGTDASAPGRSYTVAVQPEAYSRDAPGNTLKFDPSEARTLVVILRYYVPQGSDTARVPLPAIEA